MQQNKSLVILNWNGNGLRQLKQQLINYLHQQNIDIAAITETHLKPGDKFSIPNFKTYRIDRERANCGGVAILVRKSLRHSVLPNTPENENLETTGIIARTASGNYKIFACYSLPKMPIDEKELDAIFNTKTLTFALGDFNAKNTNWNSTITTTKGKRFQQYVENRSCEVFAPDEPTIIPANYGLPDVIDIMIVKNSTKFIESTAYADLSSDHNPVIIKINEKYKQKVETRTYIHWDKFKEEISVEKFCINSANQLDTLVKKFTEHIQNAIEKAKYTIKRNNTISNTPQNIIQLIQQERKLRKEFQRTLDPNIKRELNRVTAELRDELKEINNEWTNKLDKINHTDNPWKIVKRLKNTRIDIPSLINEEGKHAITDAEKAKLFANQLENQFKPNPTHDTEFDDAITKTVNKLLETLENH